MPVWSSLSHDLIFFTCLGKLYLITPCIFASGCLVYSFLGNSAATRKYERLWWVWKWVIGLFIIANIAGGYAFIKMQYFQPFYIFYQFRFSVINILTDRRAVIYCIRMLLYCILHVVNDFLLMLFGYCTVYCIL